MKTIFFILTTGIIFSITSVSESRTIIIFATLNPAFFPSTVNAEVGDTIRFTGTITEMHHSTICNGSINTILPAGAQPWSSPDLDLSGFYYVIRVAGHYRYKCGYAYHYGDIYATSAIHTKIKVLFEGMYSPAFNQLIRKDSSTAYLHQSVSPFNIIDSAVSVIDSISFAGTFDFHNAPTGTYYISVKHFNSIETWSKDGGELLSGDGTVYNYDFTTFYTQAYGNNLILKGSKYCIYSGDIDRDGYITLFDMISVHNAAVNMLTGRNLPADLTGDGIVDLSDVMLCYNNSSEFVSMKRP